MTQPLELRPINPNLQELADIKSSEYFSTHHNSGSRPICGGRLFINHSWWVSFLRTKVSLCSDEDRKGVIEAVEAVLQPLTSSETPLSTKDAPNLTLIKMNLKKQNLVTDSLQGTIERLWNKILSTLPQLQQDGEIELTAERIVETPLAPEQHAEPLHPIETAHNNEIVQDRSSGASSPVENLPLATKPETPETRDLARVPTSSLSTPSLNPSLWPHIYSVAERKIRHRRSSLSS